MDAEIEVQRHRPPSLPGDVFSNDRVVGFRVSLGHPGVMHERVSIILRLWDSKVQMKRDKIKEH